jgi:hypothetical protein
MVVAEAWKLLAFASTLTVLGWLGALVSVVILLGYSLGTWTKPPSQQVIGATMFLMLTMAVAMLICGAGILYYVK